MIRVGIIGTGFSASFHAEALARVPGVRLVAVSGSTPQRAEKFARQYGIAKAYGSAEELIADAEVEAVHNCTPNAKHFGINRMVLQAGKHVMSEKPLATSGAEASALAELAQSSRAVSAVCFNYRFYPLVAEMKAALASGQYGKPHLIYGGYTQDWLLHASDYSWRLDVEQNGQSRAMADIGSHWCDTAQYILGSKIVSLCADLQTVHPVRFRPVAPNGTFSHADQGEAEPVDVTTEDCGSVLVRFDNGVRGAFTISQVSAGRKNRLHLDIAAAQASLSWDQEHPNRLWIGRREEANRELVKDSSLLSPEGARLAHYPGGHQEGWPDGMKNLLLDFYEAIRARRAGEADAFSFATFEDGRYTMRIIDAILESNRIGGWVEIA